MLFQRREYRTPAAAQPAFPDALHVAVAAISDMDYCLTWNCKQIANAAIRDDLVAVVREAGYEPPVLCTPEELMGEDGQIRLGRRPSSKRGVA